MKNIARSIAILTLAGLAGCTPYTGSGEKPTGTGDRSPDVTIARGEDAVGQQRRALLAAGVQGLAAEEVGYYLDIQEARFRQEFVQTDIRIERRGDRLTLVLPGTAVFDPNSTDLHSAALQPLDSIARVLGEYRKTLVTVEGHTDSEGGEEYNQRLSEQRALSVARYLADKGVEVRRLLVVGYGETRPVEDNDTAEGRARNRRVALTLSPITQ